MPLMPKRVKYRKTQRGSRKGIATRNVKIDFGEFGLQTLERAWITNTQIEAARVALTRNMKRKGKLWIRIFPDKSVTARPPETRMGKGKGQPEYWVAVVRPGNILFELDGISETVARESLRLAANKLPVRTRFITRHHAEQHIPMKIQEINELTPKELVARKRELSEEIFNLRLQKQSGQLERPHLIRVARRNIARIETVLSRKAGAATAK